MYLLRRCQRHQKRSKPRLFDTWHPERWLNHMQARTQLILSTKNHDTSLVPITSNNLGSISFWVKTSGNHMFQIFEQSLLCFGLGAFCRLIDTTCRSSMQELLSEVNDAIKLKVCSILGINLYSEFNTSSPRMSFHDCWNLSIVHLQKATNIH